MRKFLKRINIKNIPKHVAIIMDGNGRWAQKRGMTRSMGYKKANISIKETVKISKALGIMYITLYVFSSENWKRPYEEVSKIIKTIYEHITNELRTFKKKKIRLLTIGNIKKFPIKIQNIINYIIKLTKKNTNITLILALNYGSKNEILRAVKKITQKVNKGEITIDKINKNIFEKCLYTKNIPDVDLIIRTSGEKRISNFMLWQAAYAELYFTKVLWPDFRKKHFLKAIIEYQKRKRRFGNI